jgi:hypothetical protein
MLILDKNVFPDRIEWKVQKLDTATQQWSEIGITSIDMEKMLSILAGLKVFPVEIREKIFYQLVTSAFEASLFLQQVSRQINAEYEAEKQRLIESAVHDFLEFLMEASIHPNGEMLYHFITFLEKDYGPVDLTHNN